MAQSNGGVSTVSRLTLFPMQETAGGATGFYAFDPSAGYDDATSGGFYAFKVEEVLPGRVPTFGQAVIKYRDLGVARFTLVLTGVREDQTVETKTIAVTVGNRAPTARIMTAIVGLGGFTAKDVQLTVGRAPGDGPLSIVKIVLCGRVETQQEFA